MYVPRDKGIVVRRRNCRGVKLGNGNRAWVRGIAAVELLLLSSSELDVMAGTDFCSCFIPVAGYLQKVVTMCLLSDPACLCFSYPCISMLM